MLRYSRIREATPVHKRLPPMPHGMINDVIVEEYLFAPEEDGFALMGIRNGTQNWDGNTALVIANHGDISPCLLGGGPYINVNLKGVNESSGVGMGDTDISVRGRRWRGQSGICADAYINGCDYGTAEAKCRPTVNPSGWGQKTAHDINAAEKPQYLRKAIPVT